MLEMKDMNDWEQNICLQFKWTIHWVQALFYFTLKFAMIDKTKQNIKLQNINADYFNICQIFLNYEWAVC